MATTKVTPVEIYNPYKFNVYLSADQGISANVWNRINLNTKVFDTSNAFDNITNYRYVIPVSGYWMISAQAKIAIAGAASGASIQASLYKNSIAYVNSSVTPGSGSGNSQPHFVINKFDHFNAGDYLELCAYISEAGRGVGSGQHATFMTGFCVSTT